VRVVERFSGVDNQSLHLFYGDYGTNGSKRVKSCEGGSWSCFDWSSCQFSSSRPIMDTSTGYLRTSSST
jgi:hypothetical protein